SVITSNSLPSGTPPKPNLIGGTYFLLRCPAPLCVSFPGAARPGGDAISSLAAKAAPAVATPRKSRLDVMSQVPQSECANSFKGHGPRAHGKLNAVQTEPGKRGSAS